MKRALSFMLSMILFMVWTPAIAEGYADMLAKGDAFLASGDYAEAIASYQLAQRLQPDNVLAFLGEANVRIMLEDYAKPLPWLMRRWSWTPFLRMHGI